MNKIERIKTLVQQLNQHSYNYYTLDKPTISDKAYDLLYSELETLEKETNCILSNSPTQKVQGEVLPHLTKVKHTEAMLSADKSKDINDIINFMGNQECVLSWKLDGLTLVIKFNEGKFQQAITRGGGIEGEDVSHTVRTFSNIPLTIDYKGYLEIRGEGLVPFEEFNRINEELIVKGEDVYSSARSLSAGSVRQLDSNIAKSRNLIFLAFGIIKCDNFIPYKKLQFDFLTSLGFEVVYHEITNRDNIKEKVEDFKSNIPTLPFLTDGLIIEFNDTVYGKAQGSTGHHSKDMMALKHNDDTYETIFRGVELNTTRTGMVSITALFDNVNMDGVNVSRASLHNYDIFSELELGIGDTILTYRANSVIPQVEENLTRSNTYEIEMKCPSCNEEITINQTKNSRFLICNNPNCKAKLVQKISHYVSRDALNIDGLSEATIEKLIDNKFINSIIDLYSLEKHKKEIIKLDGMGLKSYNNLISSIEKSKLCTPTRLLYGLGISNVGKGTGRDLMKHFNNDFYKFLEKTDDLLEFYKIEGIGEITARSIVKWFKDLENVFMLDKILEYVKFEEDKPIIVTITNSPFTNKKIYCTGTFASHKKEELKQLVQSLGGEFASGYAKSLDYLVIGKLKGSSKEVKAIKDGVKVLQEDDFLEMIK